MMMNGAKKFNAVHPATNSNDSLLNKTSTSNRSQFTKLFDWFPLNLHSKHSTISNAKRFIALVPVPMCIVERNGDISNMNQVFHDKIYIRSNLGTIQAMEIISPESHGAFHTMLTKMLSKDTLSTKISGEFHTRMRKGINDENNELYQWTITCNETRQVFFLTGTVIDKSLIKEQIEESLRSTVLERESQLKSISKTLETKRIFVRHVSHEIRTPLNIVLSGVEILLKMKNKLSNEIHDIHNDMNTACVTAIEILNDFLTYEKLDADILTLDKSICDPIELVQQVGLMFQIQAKNSEVKLLIENTISTLLDHPIHMNIDASKITQVFRNLVSNSLKFTPSGGMVTIRSLLSLNKQQLRFEIQDTGVGMSKEERRRLFNEIIQFNPHELQKGGGSGLGLFISRRIIDMHKGSIGVDMEYEGPGSIFYVELPLPLKGEPGRRSYINTTLDSFKAPPTLNLNLANSHLRLLLVDDASLILKFHRRMLMEYNVECEDVCNGYKAVEKVKESIATHTPYDAILMDAQMPIMGGLEAAKMIRGLGYKGKIFGITGSAFKTDMDDFILHGADEVIPKPISMKKYAHIVQSSLLHEDSSRIV